MSRKTNTKAAVKGQPRRVGHALKIGDRIRIIEISEDDKDLTSDQRDAYRQEMRTGELFRFCLGRVFTIFGFDRHGNVELRVSNSPAVRKKFGKWHLIWCEPEFVRLVRRKKLSS